MLAVLYTLSQFLQSLGAIQLPDLFVEPGGLDDETAAVNFSCAEGSVAYLFHLLDINSNQVLDLQVTNAAESDRTN